MVELVGASAEAADTLKLADMLAFDAVLGALQFMVVGTGLTHGVEFLLHNSLYLFEAPACVCRNLDEELACDFLAVVIDADVAGNLAFIDEAAIEPAALAVAKNSSQNFQGRFLFVERWAGGPD